MENIGWGTRISFLLAAAIFVLSQMIVGGARNGAEDSTIGPAAIRVVQGRGLWDVPAAASQDQTDGRSRY
jgi:hypothetical protein